MSADGQTAPQRGLGDLVSADAKLRQLCTGATWSEGPVWIPGRDVVRWSDIPGNRILEAEAEADALSGALSVYQTDVEFTNGRTLDDSGAVIQCSHGRRAIERDVDGQLTVLVDSWNGARFNSPNDVIVACDGTIWFTDPPYGIVQPHEGHPGEQEYGANFVFRFDPKTGSVHPVVTDLEEPNGWQDEQFSAWVRSRTPAGRWGEVKDLVGTLRFLVSSASDFVNGQVIYVDGGMTAVV
ncbi:MAG: SDR family oxidoreductase [Leifsonia sp.]